MLATIKLPKNFDVGDAQPGDDIDVTAHCKLSADGRSLEVVSLDDSGGMNDEMAPPPPDGDGDPDGGGAAADEWEAMMGRKNNQS